MDRGSAKLCAPYLGSTKQTYFDENLDFDPKREGVDGEYSVLTRALRSDDVSTGFPLRTVGVNTRVLSPEQASTLTNNQVSYGAVIEENVEFGVPAFLNNPDASKDQDYGNPLEGDLQVGDVIFKVNGQQISPLYTFDTAIKQSYDLVKFVIDMVNDDKPGQLDDFPYPIAIEHGDALSQGDISRVSANIGIEVYRNGVYWCLG